MPGRSGRRRGRRAVVGAGGGHCAGARSPGRRVPLLRPWGAAGARPCARWRAAGTTRLQSPVSSPLPRLAVRASCGPRVSASPPTLGSDLAAARCPLRHFGSARGRGGGGAGGAAGREPVCGPGFGQLSAGGSAGLTVGEKKKKKGK